MKKKQYIDGDNTTIDWQKQINDILVFPIGAFEQHDAHLPLNTDNISAEYFARIIASEFQAALLPTQKIATSLEHTGFRGSFTLKPETLMQIVRDIVDDAERQNFSILIIVNGHGGNLALAPVCRDINRLDRKTKILLINPFEHADKGLTESSLKGEMDIHAGESETSRYMAIKGMETISIFGREQGKHSGLKQSDLTTFGIGCLNPEGAIGDPGKASAETGHKLNDSIIKNMIPFIKERIDRLRINSRYSGRGGLVVRRMDKSDMPVLEALAKQANWNQVEEDWVFFIKNFPKGGFVMVHQGRAVGSVVTISYDQDVAWIGMVLVNPEFRRMGIASRLMKAAMDSAANCNTIKLDATPAGKKVYDKLGFADECSLFRLINNCVNGEFAVSDCISTMSSEDLPSVIEFDRNYSDYNRGVLIRALLKRQPEICTVYRSGGIVQGYCLGRQGRMFTQIGPIVADSSEIALKLCQAALAKLKGKAVLIDVVNQDTDFSGFLEKSGFHLERDFIRMYRGEKPYSGKPDHIFAIAGPELG